MELILNKNREMKFLESIKKLKNEKDLIDALTTIDGFFYIEKSNHILIDFYKFIRNEENINKIEEIKNKCEEHKNDNDYFEKFKNAIIKVGLNNNSKDKIIKKEIEMIYNEIQGFCNEEDIDYRYLFNSILVLIVFLKSY